MGKFYISKRVVLAAAVGAVFCCAVPNCFAARYRRHHKPHDPIYVVAAKHHWNRTQVGYWLDVLWRESRSSLGHYDLWAVNGNCVGVGQLNGGWGAYARYGGSARTALGQLTGMGNYIAGRYGSPAGAEAHEIADGWY